MKRDFGKNSKKQRPIYSKLLTISYKKRCHLPFIPLRKLRHNSILSVESLLVVKVELSTLHKSPLLISIYSHYFSDFTEGTLNSAITSNDKTVFVPRSEMPPKL